MTLMTVMTVSERYAEPQNPPASALFAYGPRDTDAWSIYPYRPYCSLGLPRSQDVVQNLKVTLEQFPGST